MRCVIVGLVLAACNPVFGLDPTKPYDDAGPPNEGPTLDAPSFRPILLTKLVVTSSLVAGVPTAKVERDLPLDVDPQVQIALMSDDSNVATESRAYTGNSIGIPIEYPGRAWRMVATLDGRVHEYQWMANEGAHVTASPSFGHQTPAAVPTGSKWSITPNNVPVQKQWNDVRFFTSGVWTESHRSTANPNPPSSTFPFDLHDVTQPNASLPPSIFATQPIVGPFGTPDSAGAGDWQAMLEQGARDGAGCINTIGSTWQQVDLHAGGESASTPTWNTATVAAKMIPIEGDINRFTDASLEARDSPPAVARRLNALGYAPAGGIPAFNRSKVPSPLTVDVRIERPVMVTLVECEPKQELIPAHVDVPQLLALPSMAPTYYMQMTESRTVPSGPELITALQGAIQSASLGATTSLDLAAPLAKEFKLEGTTYDLTLRPDYSITVALPTVPRMLTLTWSTEPENLPVRPADAWDVTLHYIDGTALVPVRTFHVTAPSVKIDSSIFNAALYPQRKYIFEIKSRVGVPMAAAGDYSQVSYPYSTAKVFTWAFAVTP